jgi:hypothetical protein
VALDTATDARYARRCLKTRVAGRVTRVHEVGRGPLAGRPGVRPAVVLARPLSASLADLIDDSKAGHIPCRDLNLDRHSVR